MKEVSEEWIEKTRRLLTLLIDEYELPKDSLYLSENKGRVNADKTISYSVCIYEPDFPEMPDAKRTQNKIVLTIMPPKTKNNQGILEFVLRENQEGDLREFLPADAEIKKQTKSDKASNTIRVSMPQTSENLISYIKQHTEYCIRGYESKAARFACCSFFRQCSDAKKCIHENKLYSKACIYRSNLEQGRIFYGKNRNID